MRQSRDPFWLNARRAGACARCGRKIARGDRAYYYPNERKLLCKSEDCGEQAARSFAAQLDDERMMSGSSY